MAYGLCVGVVVAMLLSLGGWAVAQPVPPSPRSAEVEVLQASRAFCEQQLASMLDQARMLQRQVDELKKQLAAKETPHE